MHGIHFETTPSPAPTVHMLQLHGNGQLQSHGISRQRPEMVQIPNHWTQEWVESVPISTQQAHARAIANNKAFALTDGSYKVQGSTGFRIADFKGRLIKEHAVFQDTNMTKARIAANWQDYMQL